MSLILSLRMSLFRSGRRSSSPFDIAQCVHVFLRVQLFARATREFYVNSQSSINGRSFFLEMKLSDFPSVANGVGKICSLSFAILMSTDTSLQPCSFSPFAQDSMFLPRSFHVNIMPTIRTNSAYFLMRRFCLIRQGNDVELNNVRESVWSGRFALSLLDEFLLE